MAAFRILVADDHEVVRKGLIAILKQKPEWQVCGEAADGREAIEQAKQLMPDVIVMDISMPRLNGLEATRHLMKERPGHKSPGSHLSRFRSNHSERPRRWRPRVPSEI